MGEVYRARDVTLDREMAIKRLPDSVANDPERLARFEREAKTLAFLNHPTVAQIYAVESGSIVMELVPGQTLSGTPAARSCAQLWGADCIRARCGARARHHPSRSQTGQRDCHARRRGQGTRLRSRRPRQQRGRSGSQSLADDDRHVARRHSRHPPPTWHPSRQVASPSTSAPTSLRSVWWCRNVDGSPQSRARKTAARRRASVPADDES